MSRVRNIDIPGFFGGLVIGMTIGANMMYYFDPEAGRGRRSLVRDRMLHLARVGEHFVEERGRKVVSRAGEVVASARGVAGVRSREKSGESRLGNRSEAST